MHQPNHFEIYRTSLECCEAHFSSSSTCLQDSKDSHAPFPWPGTEGERPFAPGDAASEWSTVGSHRKSYFPDLVNKLNCVYGSNYEHWMTEGGFGDFYLFQDAEECCKKWYPARGDCPASERAVSPEAEDEAWHSDPYPMSNYYFPDFERSSCGYGRDYPAWMGYNSFEKHYLFTLGEECCSKFFPSASSRCPYENTEQQGYYWTSYEGNRHNLDDMPVVYNHTYYPSLDAKTCSNGTDYPSYMAADPGFKKLYLFKTLKGCCEQWYTNSGLDGCTQNVIQGKYDTEPCSVNRPDCNYSSSGTKSTEVLLSMWYPHVDGNRCKNDKAMPKWMLAEGYTTWYLFSTRDQCCAAFRFC